MRDVAILFIHLIATVARFLGPGGTRSVVAESVLVKHQLLLLNRSRSRSPNLRPRDRVIAGLCAALMRPTRLLRSAIVLKPATILDFHRALVKRKYRLLFRPKRRRKPGPKGPSRELIAAYWLSTITLTPALAARPGSLSWATPRTVSGVWISSAANRSS